MLGLIKHGDGGGSVDESQPAWAPRAFVVSFKLETNRAILLAKAAGALAKYDVDVVCANLLQSYKREVTLVVASDATDEGEAKSKKPRVAVSVSGDEVKEVGVEGISCMTIALGDDQAG